MNKKRFYNLVLAFIALLSFALFASCTNESDFDDVVEEPIIYEGVAYPISYDDETGRVNLIIPQGSKESLTINMPYDEITFADMHLGSFYRESELPAGETYDILCVEIDVIVRGSHGISVSSGVVHHTYVRLPFGTLSVERVKTPARLKKINIETGYGLTGHFTYRYNYTIEDNNAVQHG